MCNVFKELLKMNKKINKTMTLDKIFEKNHQKKKRGRHTSIHYAYQMNLSNICHLGAQTEERNRGCRTARVWAVPSSR